MKIILERIQEWARNSIVDEILVFALLISIFESFAQNTIKNAEDNTSTTMFMGIALYACVGYILHYTYKNYPLNKINVVWSCVSIVFAISVGYLFYGEPITKWSMLSAMLALSAIYVINL